MRSTLVNSSTSLKSKMLKKYSFFLFPFFIAAQCSAQVFEKNGLPCVSEICLGDSLAELSKIHWEVPKNVFGESKKPVNKFVRKLSDNQLGLLKSVFRGDVVSAASFLDGNYFDSSALSALARLTAACARHELIGTYITKSGIPTSVGISLIPTQSDTTKHQWTVVSIGRTFPTAVTTEQKVDVTSRHNERYAAFDVRNTGHAKTGDGLFNWNLSFYGPLGFRLWMFRDLDEGNRMKLHSACGGTERVRID